MFNNKQLNHYWLKAIFAFTILFFYSSASLYAFDIQFEALGPTELTEGESVDIRISFIPDTNDFCAAELTLADPIGNRDRIDGSFGPIFDSNTANNSDMGIHPSRTSFFLSYHQFGDSQDHADSKIITYTASTDAEYLEVTEFFRDHYVLDVRDIQHCHTLPDIQLRHFPQITILNHDPRTILTPEFDVIHSTVEAGSGDITIAELGVAPIDAINASTCSVAVDLIASGGTAVEGEDFEFLAGSTAGTFDSQSNSTMPVRIKLLDNPQSNENRILSLTATFSVVQNSDSSGSNEDCRLLENKKVINKEITIEDHQTNNLTAILEQTKLTLKEGVGISEVANVVFSMPTGELPDDNCSVTATVKISGGTAEIGKDFDFTERLITYKAGDGNTKNVPISLDVLAGVVDEDKTVQLQATFSNTMGSASSCPLLSLSSQEIEVVISDDPYDKPVITLTSSSSAPSEGETIKMVMALQVQNNQPLSARSIGSCKMSVEWVTNTNPSKELAREGLDYIIVDKPTEIDFSQPNPIEIEVDILNDGLLEGDEILEIEAVVKGEADPNNPQCALIPETKAGLTNVVIKDKTTVLKVAPEPEVLNDRVCAALIDSVGNENELVGNDRKYFDSNCKNQSTETKRNFEPEEIATQTNAVLGAATRQLRNVRSRLDKLRSSDGQRGIDVAGANLNIQGTSLSVGLLGGGASGDENELLKNSRWGLFANGEYAFGEKDQGSDIEVGSGDRNFDFNSTGLTIGADYRFPGEKMIAGAAIGYKDFESEYSDQKGFTNTKGTNISLYGTYLLSDKSYLDAVVGFGRDKVDSQRPVNNDGSTSEATFAIGKPDAKEYTFSVGGGYEFRREEWIFSPYGRFDYTKGTIDAYKEVASDSSADTSMFSVNKQSIESLTSSLGVKASRVYSTSTGVFIPHASLEWKHDFKARGVISGNSVFLQDFNTSLLSDSTFEEAQKSNIDKNYYNLSVGVSAVLPKGRSAYLNFESRLGDSSIKDNAVKAGFRWEF